MTCVNPRQFKTGDGVTTLFTFTFPILSESDVYVSLYNKDTYEYEVQTRDTQWSFANATTVEFVTAPPVCTVDGESIANVLIFRSTSVCPLPAEFYPGSAIRAQDLNNNFELLQYAVAENAAGLDVALNNATDLADIAVDVAANAANIADNTADIASNAASIANNAGAISSNTANITTNLNSIADNTTTIEANTYFIEQNLQNIEALETDVATNTSDISSLDVRVTDNEADIKAIQENPSTIPIASASILGGIKVGANLNITADGTLSAVGSPTGIVYKGTADLTQTAPSAVNGDFYVNTVAGTVNASWTGLGGQTVVGGERVLYNGSSWDMLPNPPEPEYNLPAATASVLGGVKVGSNLSVTGDGTLSANATSVPIATTDVLGKVQVGVNLSITPEGILSSSGGDVQLPDGAYEGAILGWANNQLAWLGGFTPIQPGTYGPITAIAYYGDVGMWGVSLADPNIDIPYGTAVYESDASGNSVSYVPISAPITTINGNTIFLESSEGLDNFKVGDSIKGEDLELTDGGYFVEYNSNNPSIENLETQNADWQTYNSLAFVSFQNIYNLGNGFTMQVPVNSELTMAFGNNCGYNGVFTVEYSVDNVTFTTGRTIDWKNGGSYNFPLSNGQQYIKFTNTEDTNCYYNLSSAYITGSGISAIPYQNSAITVTNINPSGPSMSVSDASTLAVGQRVTTGTVKSGAATINGDTGSSPNLLYFETSNEEWRVGSFITAPAQQIAKRYTVDGVFRSF